MRLNPPTIFIFLISLILAILALISQLGLVHLPYLMPNQSFWLAIGGYGVLMIGNLVRGL